MKSNTCGYAIRKVSYVYLFGSVAYGWCKIGMSTQPLRRYRNLETGLPFPISIWDIRKVSSPRQARILEAHLHHAFRACRLHGEWFDHKFFDMAKYFRLVKKYESAFEGPNPLKESE